MGGGDEDCEIIRVSLSCCMWNGVVVVGGW